MTDDTNLQLWRRMTEAEEFLLRWQIIAEDYIKKDQFQLLKDNSVLFHLAEARRAIYLAQKEYDDYITRSVNESLTRKRPRRFRR